MQRDWSFLVFLGLFNESANVLCQRNMPLLRFMGCDLQRRSQKAIIVRLIVRFDK
jgi:hypothetical protein